MSDHSPYCSSQTGPVEECAVCRTRPPRLPVNHETLMEVTPVIDRCLRRALLASTVLLGVLTASCATLATPERCEQAAAGLATVEQIAAVLVNRGVESERAAKLARAVVTGQLLLAAACAQAAS